MYHVGCIWSIPPPLRIQEEHASRIIINKYFLGEPMFKKTSFMDNLRYFANKQLVWLHYSAQCALLHNLQYNIYIYIWYPPRPTFQTNLVVFTLFFLAFELWNLWHVLVIKNCNFVQACSHPTLSEIHRAQDSRFKIPKKLLESKALDPRFKIQDPKKTYWIQGDRIQDSRSPQKNWIRRPSALNLESKEVGLKKFFLSLESWILNPKRLGWIFFFLSLESWIQNPDT